MATKKSKPKKQPALKYADYPLIGYEYEYIGQPVRVLRVLPCQGKYVTERDAHVEFESRYGDRSSCDAGELGKWQDIDKPLTKNNATMAMLEIREALEDATTDDERKLCQWQLRRLKKFVGKK